MPLTTDADLYITNGNRMTGMRLPQTMCMLMLSLLMYVQYPAENMADTTNSWSQIWANYGSSSSPFTTLGLG